MNTATSAVLLAVLLAAGCVRMDDDFAREQPAAQPAGTGTAGEPPQPATTGTASTDAGGESSTPPPAPGKPADPEINRLLEQAEWAVDAGRLNHPPGFSARDFYQQVLRRDPANEAARAGLGRVIEESIERSLAAARGGDYKRAELYLTRAGKFAFNDPRIRGARRYIHSLSRAGRRSFALPAEAVRLRDAEKIDATLELIAEHAVENRALIEIHVADDLQGVWLFGQLRRHAGKEPLHATIHDAAEPEVRLVWRR